MFKFAVLSVLLCTCAAYKEEESRKSIELPVKSNYNLEIINIPSEQEERSTSVNVESGVLPVYFTFKTQSSPLIVKQEHRGTKGSSQRSESKDEPHQLVHEVSKEVIQELKETITPWRRVVQVIEPVREERLIKVYRGERKSGGEGKGESVRQGEIVGKGESVRQYESVRKGESEGKGESVRQGEIVGKGESVRQYESVGKGESVRQGESVGKGESVRYRESVGKGESVRQGESVGKGESVRYRESVGKGESEEKGKSYMDKRWGEVDW